MSHIFYKFLILLSCTLLFACESKRWEIDSDAQEIELSIQRFEKELFDKASPNFKQEDSQEMQERFPEFYPLYINGIMRFEQMDRPAFFNQINRFFKDENIQALYKDVSETYTDLNFAQEELSDAFTRYHYFFPDHEVPKLLSFISAFSYSFVTDENILGIGLDNYLGADYKFYPQAGIPQYLFKHFSKEYMTSDAMKAWLTTEFENEEGANLLQHIVHDGKILYLTKAFLPKKEEHIVLRYTKEELEWCEENEQEIWFHFVDNDILYSNDNLTISKYAGEAPFVAGFPEGSPGRVGKWLGYQIVKKYMDEQQDASLKDLLNAKASVILTESKYKPRR